MSDPVDDLKQELLAAAERRHRPRSRKRPLLAAAVLAVAAVAALVLTAPWSGSPSFLEKAEAALTPRAGTILHQKWEVTVRSTDPACTVTRGPNEIWVDQAPPHRYRALLSDLPEPDPRNDDPGALPCSSGTTAELGGAFDSGETVRFVPPNAVVPWDDLRFAFPLDPVGDLREWLAAGTAHDEGNVELDGRTVRRILIDPPSDCSALPACPDEPFVWYADPETYAPVETRGPGYIALPGRPAVRVELVMRFLTFERLPRTEANLALTDIWAQHPGAAGP